MAQTPATRSSMGEYLDYTPSGAVSAGDVVVLNGRVRVAERGIAASTPGAVAATGVFTFPKDTSTFSDGDPVYWQAAGSPVTGTASSGAASNASVGGTFAGHVIPGGAALTGDSNVKVRLVSAGGVDGAGGLASRTVAATGSVIANAAAIGTGMNYVTAADATKGVQLPVAVAGIASMVIVKNDDAANAILKVYGQTNAAINALSANSAISLAAKTSALFVSYSPTQWYTLPLLPS